MKEIISIGGYTLAFLAIVSALVYFAFKTFLIEQITQRVKIDYDKQLETFKSELLSEQMNLTRILESQNQGYHLSQTQRLQAVKEFWKSYISMRATVQILAELDSFLLPNEMRGIDSKHNEALIRLKEGVEPTRRQKLNIAYEQIEFLRPFLNEEIWKQISFLTFFCGRLLYLYSNSLIDNKSFYWSDDEYLLSTTLDILTKAEYAHTSKLEMGQIKSILYFTERKILLEIDNILTGKAASEFTMQHSIALSKLNTKEKLKW